MLAANDKLRISAETTATNSNHTIADGSRITIVQLKGEKGDTGDTGPSGGVDTSGTPVANDFARFVDADTIEGRSYAEVRADLNVENGADVTDAANVNAAGATMNTDTNVSGNSWVLDEDDMSSNSATKVPTQQSVKAYVDAEAPWTKHSTIATTSGSSKTFSSIPSGVTQMLLLLNEVSASGTEHFLAELGDAGGIETTGYYSTSTINTTGAASTSGMILQDGNAGGDLSGIMHFVLSDGNHWVQFHAAVTYTGYACHGGGDKSLSAELTQLPRSMGRFKYVR